MNKAKNQELQEQPKILSPRDDHKQPGSVDQGSLTPEKMEKELEPTLIRDIEGLMRRLNKQDFS